jgi:mediator of RNA polymerase II transcription subunit 5
MLKTTCTALAAKPQLLDVVAMFTSPVTILQPLCQLLDAWRYDDDQGKSSSNRPADFLLTLN